MAKDEAARLRMPDRMPWSATSNWPWTVAQLAKEGDMPKRTDAEWQALSDRLAREIPGWMTWDELSIEEQAKQFHQPTLWWKRLESGKPWATSLTLSAWRPHKNVGQAMLVLRTLLAKIGRDASALLSLHSPPGRCRVTIHNWVAAGGIPAMLVGSPHVDNESHAICLAIEAWLDAQEEEQHALQML